LRHLTVHSSDDDSILVFSKSATAEDGTEDTVIVVVNVDPHGTRETTVHLNMPALGMDWFEQFSVHDEISGGTWTWGEHNYVRLDPFVEPAHIFRVERRGRPAGAGAAP
jgi:starch synthase (maltosyl-transferring)